MVGHISPSMRVGFNSMCIKKKDTLLGVFFFNTFHKEKTP